MQHIRLRGVRQNNLKGFDLDLPLGRLIVVTGLSGTGKSSLVFETLHAEGQRRYVETFSPYVRQFLEMLDQPRVGDIENIRPSIAIKQGNTVKTSRSTVGTMTELCDFFKVWFCHLAELFDPDTGEKIDDDNPQSIWKKVLSRFAGRIVLPVFSVHLPNNFSREDIVKSLRGQGYTRVITTAGIQKLDEIAARGPEGLAKLYVVQDRLKVQPDVRSRFIEAAETALHFGQGELSLFSANGNLLARYSEGLNSPATGHRFRRPSPALFSFNSPLGACPGCRGFGRIIEIDYRLVIPDHSLSLRDGAIRAFAGNVYSESRRDLLKACRRVGFPADIPYRDLTEEQAAFVIEGEPGYGEDGREWPKSWYGVKRFFKWLESNTYKMHIRVFLSKYRAYVTCPDCTGMRLQPEALNWKWRGRTLPDLYRLPVSNLLTLLQKHHKLTGRLQVDIAAESILTRLKYIDQVGLGYLTLDRTSRTLSGGEVERVNLTSCLGTSLVDTLFVLDEPSIGLHSRDIDRLIEILKNLTGQGNTVVVVEHDEAIMRAADHIIELGPRPGSGGGELTFAGNLPDLLNRKDSITGAYLAGRKTIPVPARRLVRPGKNGRKSSEQKDHPHIYFHKASKHNISNLSFRLPLQRLVCISGVSGSGKSTLLDNIVCQGMKAKMGKPVEDPARIENITLHFDLNEVVLVDQ